MMMLLPTQTTVIRLLQLLLICSCQFVLPMPPLRRNIIKVRASGFLPFESDLLLPLGILRQLQAQDRASRLLPQQYIKPARRKPKPKPKPKQQVRLESAHMHGNKNTADAGIQMYNLIDDDGQLLLNLRVHNDNNNNNGNSNLDASSLTLNRLEERGTPWRASLWRPTTSAPLSITSSSPRPLPLHQYLSSNSLDQSQSQSPKLTQQRRMFGARQDWLYKAPIFN